MDTDAVQAELDALVVTYAVPGVQVGPAAGRRPHGALRGDLRRRRPAAGRAGRAVPRRLDHQGAHRADGARRRPARRDRPGRAVLGAGRGPVGPLAALDPGADDGRAEPAAGRRRADRGVRRAHGGPAPGPPAGAAVVLQRGVVGARPAAAPAHRRDLRGGRAGAARRPLAFGVPDRATAGHAAQPDQAAGRRPAEYWPAASAAGSRWWVTADELLDQARLHLRDGEGVVDADVVRGVRAPGAPMPGADGGGRLGARLGAVGPRRAPAPSAGPGSAAATGRTCAASPTRTPRWSCWRTAPGRCSDLAGGSALFDALLPSLLEQLGVPALPEPAYVDDAGGRTGPGRAVRAGRPGGGRRRHRPLRRCGVRLARVLTCERLGGNTFTTAAALPGAMPFAVDGDLLYVGPFALPARGLTRLREVLRRRHADGGAEVAAEVRLVEPAEIGCEGGQVVDLAGVDGGGGVLQPVALEHPLGADADVPVEQPLQRPRGGRRARSATSSTRTRVRSCSIAASSSSSSR